MTDPSDSYTQFTEAPIEAQLQMLAEPGTAALIRARIGSAAYREYERLARAVPPGGSTLGDHAVNLVVVPGIMGSLLVSRGLGGMWWLDAPRELGRLDSIGLTPDGRTDATKGADLAAVGLDAKYFAFQIAALEHDDLGHRGYPYDWRKPLTVAADGLITLVGEIYDANGGLPVHLAAHSMGGLVVRTALMRQPALWDKVGRIAFMGTPHYGCPAIAGYLKNHFWGVNLLHVLGKFLSRATFRSMWGALSLLPAPSGVYPGTRPEEGDDDDPTHHPCANFDLYDASAYRLDLSSVELTRLQTVLTSVADFHRELRAAHVALSQQRRDRMAMIAGVGQRTLFRIAYQPAFGFGWEVMDRVTARRPGDRHRDGDGRVPLASAELEHLGELRYVKAEHVALPSVPAVWSDVFAWLTGATMTLATTPAGALTAVLSGEADSATPVLSGRSAAAALDDPGYLDVDAPDPAAVDALTAQLNAGQLPEFLRVHLL